MVLQALESDEDRFLGRLGLGIGVMFGVMGLSDDALQRVAFGGSLGEAPIELDFQAAPKLQDR